MCTIDDDLLIEESKLVIENENNNQKYGHSTELTM